MATDKELSDFLKETEKKAFKRTYYHVRNEDAAWPETTTKPNAVEVTFTAGWTEATLPRALRRAVCVLVAAWFEDRTASAPKAVGELVQPYRRVRI